MAVAQRAEAWGASTHRPYAPPFVSRRISFQMVSLSLSLLHHHVIPMARRETHRDGEIILHSNPGNTRDARRSARDGLENMDVLLPPTLQNAEADQARP